MTRNRLTEETSPYLLQHADNPVHWRGWNAEALMEARNTDKPILLSIGYAACHWCHVMAHESFENPEIAAVMNDRFVNVKVDREERPDLDTIYQHALQLMGQQGGWPLTMFLTPAGEPFWGGTYFPPERRFGRPGFPEVLTAISDFYRDNRDGVREHVGKLRGALAQLWSAPAGGDIPLSLIDEAARRLIGEFDPTHGGIRGAPKFPNPSIIELVWSYAIRSGDGNAERAVLNTLDHMCQGGIYDHLGGGFARYATDEAWLVPHFEKMLYDNAQIIELLTHAWRKTRNPLYAQRVAETVDWTLREMIAEGGAFAATLDADSEGVEGKYYVWSADEIAGILKEDADRFCTVYDVTAQGNWEGRNILNRNHPEGTYDPRSETALTRCRAALLDARAQRVRPGWDDKVLADWNGLMIAALADAGSTFERPDWLEAARRAFDFIISHMQNGTRLLHSFRNGEAKQMATLDDYAFLARAAVSLYEATAADSYLNIARQWLTVLDEHYPDHEGGGYFFTADDAEALFVRTKSAHDNATPAGNAVVAQTSAKLHLLTGDATHHARAQGIIHAFSGAVTRNFFPLATLLTAVETLQATTQIVLIGNPDGEDTRRLAHAAYTAPCPARLVAFHSPGQELPPEHPAAGKGQRDNAATAYVCVGTTCGLPLTDPDNLRQTLSGE